MVRTHIVQSDRQASSTRLTVLLLFLLVVGAGCIYEFAFARPKFQAAWEEIQKIDQSRDSSNFTAEQIEELMQQAPHRVDADVHPECVVHTYRWPSGLLVKNHDIHIVYTKLNEKLLSHRPELKGQLYYYSASAGQPLDLDLNFPKDKQTIVENLNAPMMAMGGGAPPPARQGGADKKGDEEKQDDGEAAAPDDEKQSDDDKKSDDDDKKSDDDDKKSDDDEKQSGDDDKQSDNDG